MEHSRNQNERPVNPRRRKRGKMQIFKETYLPAIIAALAILLVITFIIGSIVRAIQRTEKERIALQEASIAESIARQKLDNEAADLLKIANDYAMTYDYDNAITTLNNFTGADADYPSIASAKEQYKKEQSKMIPWTDLSKIINLSFQLLIEDPTRAFKDAKYGTSYNKNFITTAEFSKILQQLYENNYILISLSDANDQLCLPEGKNPLILTQTQVNYYTYMTDSNGDRLPDSGGAGFANKLILDDSNNLTCQMVNSTGETVTGSFDLVPILESFIETHPDFSYKGARAVLAVTGYDGLFGYRTDSAAKDFFGAQHWEQEVSGATKVVQALRNAGYEIACYTYENIAYGSRSAEQIRSDLDSWNLEVSPILGVIDTLVYARESDIGKPNTSYSGDKFTMLVDCGFTKFLGFCTNATPWFTTQDNIVRQGRILVTGSNLAYHQEWFSGIIDPSSVLDVSRGTIPS